MALTPLKIAENVLYQVTGLSERRADTWVRHFGFKCARVAPGQTVPSGFDARVRHEAFRLVMYGAIALAPEAMKGVRPPAEVAPVRQAILEALYRAPADVAGDPTETKARIGQYHAAWKGSAASIRPILARTLAAIAGVAGTPLEAAANAISEQEAEEWVRSGLTALKFVLEH